MSACCDSEKRGGEIYREKREREREEKERERKHVRVAYLHHKNKALIKLNLLSIGIFF